MNYRLSQLRRLPSIALIVTLAWSIEALSVRGDDFFFVDPGGSDSNPGTENAPWATLQWAADHVGVGDRVTVRPGTYDGFYLTADGELGNPIEFLAMPGVLINEENGTTPDGINLEGASHVVIDGFEVAGMERTGVRTVGLPSSFATNVTIRNVYAHHNGSWGILTGHVNNLLIENNRMTNSVLEHGIYVSNSGDNPIVRNNITSDNAGAGIQLNADESEGGDGVITNALISGNVIFNNGAAGGSAINLDGVQNSRIENNLLYNNLASGISLFQDDGAFGSSGNQVVNNTIHVPDDTRWALNIQNASTNNFVRNNILINDDLLINNSGFRGAIDISADSLPGFSSDYNVLTPSFTTTGGNSTMDLAEWQAATNQDANSLAIESADLAELLINAAAGNYHLVAGSLAHEAALLAPAPDFDLLGRLRPYGASVDIGALERVLPGDYNADGEVNAADYTVWRNSRGRLVLRGAGADGDLNGTISLADYTLWKANYGQSVPGAGGSFGHSPFVPEPGIWTSLLSLAFFASQRRGHRR